MTGSTPPWWMLRRRREECRRHVTIVEAANGMRILCWGRIGGDEIVFVYGTLMVDYVKVKSKKFVRVQEILGKRCVTAREMYIVNRKLFNNRAIIWWRSTKFYIPPDYADQIAKMLSDFERELREGRYTRVAEEVPVT